jgi:hypothetical protein
MDNDNNDEYSVHENDDEAKSQFAGASNFPLYWTDGCGMTVQQADSGEMYVVFSAKVRGVEHYINLGFPVYVLPQFSKMAEASQKLVDEGIAKNAN